MIFPSWSRKVASQHLPEPLRRAKGDECYTSAAVWSQMIVKCSDSPRRLAAAAG